MSHLFVCSALSKLKKIIKRFKLLSTLIWVSLILFLSSHYISPMLPGILWNMSGTQSEKITQEVVKEIVVGRGDTLGAILRKQNLPAEDIVKLMKLASYDPVLSKLRIGQVLKFSYDIELVEQSETELIEEKLILTRLFIKTDNLKSTEFVRQDNNFVAHKITLPLKKLVKKYEATIDNNVISALKKAGMPTEAIIRLITAYSYQIDMQRQIRSGDTITVLAEKFVTSQNEFSHHGKILYASLKSQGHEYNIYLYSPSDDKKDAMFFSEDGQSVKSSLLRTPIDVVKISSQYGYRVKHPVLGFGRMHKGVDFAASIGTPIRAAGDGSVQFIGWKSGYGRFILIKHTNGISTAYAHASKFANNLKNGSKVAQGQVIAYVGNSGHATGPHLHYEIRINGVQVNPLTFKTVPRIKLAGRSLSNFQEFKKKVKKLTNQLVDSADITHEKIKNIFI